MRFKVLVGCLLVTSLIWNAFGQSTPANKLTSSEQALVDGSKKAILNTGLSEKYFNDHFKLLSVVDKPSDRRVVWQFSVDQHKAIITDSIGYYKEGTARVDTHSAGKILGQTSQITRTITRARALRIMKSCIGNFDNPVVEYGPVDGRAELLLIANVRNRLVESKSEREKEREREREEREKQKATTAGTDVIGSEEGEKEPPMIFGFVNLRTGKCTKGAAMTSPFVQ
jgi:hypothetical protein